MSEVVTCPHCSTPMEVRSGRRGAFWGCPRFPSCRGTRSFDSSGEPESPGSASRPQSRKGRSSGPPSARKTILPGDLLEATSNGLGPGKALRPGAKKGTILLEYFDAPGQPIDERHTEEVPIAELRRHHLTSETRVYWHRPDRIPPWGSGRVLGIAPDGEVEVKSSGGRDFRFFELKDLYVRWSRPLADPTQMAAVGVFESPYNVETRFPVLRSALRQRAASRGLPGLLGMSVELHAHQLAAARRVLMDRVQRYLLADEVGLGKTIEALLVLRQLIADDPGLEARIIAPPHLVGQWTDEVGTKLHPQLFPMVDVEIAAHDDPAAWESGDVLIVDEAHLLVGGGAGDPSFERLREVAHESPRLLLLSATPALHNEGPFLAMLHLLDPDVYDLSDVAGFQRRLESRQEVGRGLLGLTADGPSFLVTAALDRLERVLDGQEELLPLVHAIREAEGTDRATGIEELRRHIADTFQVHRRMIRTRRTEGLVETFPLSGRHGCQRLELPSDVWNELVDGLEAVREALTIAVEEGIVPIEGAAQTMAAVVGVFPDSDAANEILAAAGLESRLPSGVPMELLEAIADTLSYEVRAGENAVVFAPTKGMARSMARALEELVGSESVRVMHEGLDPTAVRGHVREQARSRRVNWLVADRSAEHGTNLQYADVLIHVGLPGLVTELEQRIGRLDRWSDRDTKWRAFEATPEQGVLHAWSEVAHHGFGVHDRSLAALQRAVEEQSLLAWEALLAPDCVVDDVATAARDALEQEVEAVREQDAIDAVVLGEEDRSFTVGVLAADREADATLGRAFDGLMHGGSSGHGETPGNLRFSRERDPSDGTGRYKAENPSSPGKVAPLVPLWRLAGGLNAALRHPFASHRPVAVSEGVPLLRVGFPLFERIVDFLSHDDRGRSWGLWRYNSEHTGPPEVWLRIDLHLHADPGGIAEQFEVGAAFVRRRLDSALAPRIATVFWNPVGTPLSDLRGEQLAAPYSPYKQDLATPVDRGDFNLNLLRVSALHSVLGEPLADVVRRGVEWATDEVTRQDDVNAAVDAATRTLTQRHRAIVAALRRRISSGGPDRSEVESELEFEELLLPACLNAVATPLVAVDAVGVIVLSSDNPWRLEEA